MIQNITDTERKLQTQVNLLTTTNEVLAERLAAAETEHARDLAAYELTVENLTEERDALAAKVEKLELDNDPDALTIAYMAGMERGKELESKTLTPPDGWNEAVKLAVDFMEGVKDAQLQIVDMAEAILDMDAKLKWVKP